MKQRHKVPELVLTHAEFAKIPKVKSVQDIEELKQCGVERVACRGDRGACFVCYPKAKEVFVVRFVAPNKALALQ